jgi:hypothetical protein
MSLDLDYRLSKNAFGYWILVNADDPKLAWSGPRYVPVNENGFPAGDVQVSNFLSEKDAREAASQQGLHERALGHRCVSFDDQDNCRECGAAKEPAVPARERPHAHQWETACSICGSPSTHADADPNIQVTHIQVTLTGASELHCFKLVFMAAPEKPGEPRVPLEILLHATQATDLFGKLATQLSAYMHQASAELLAIKRGIAARETLSS